MTAVQIPADLAADVAAHPDRYRPHGDLGDGSPVLVLASVPDSIAGEVCTPGTLRPDGTLNISTWFNLHATAWALVGSVDGGPRPDIGDRVLVLAPGPGGDTGEVVEIADDIDGRVFVRLDGSPRGVEAIVPVSRWAILPALPDPTEPLPSVEDAGRAQAWCPTCGSTDRAVRLVDRGDRRPCGDPMGWHDAAPDDEPETATCQGCGETIYGGKFGWYHSAEVQASWEQAHPADPTCSCAPDESGVIVHNSWAHDPTEPDDAPATGGVLEDGAYIVGERGPEVMALCRTCGKAITPAPEKLSAWRHVVGHPRHIAAPAEPSPGEGSEPDNHHQPPPGLADLGFTRAYWRDAALQAQAEAVRLRAALQRIADAVPARGVVNFTSRGIGEPVAVPQVGDIAREALGGGQ